MENSNQYKHIYTIQPSLLRRLGFFRIINNQPWRLFAHENLLEGGRIAQCMVGICECLNSPIAITTNLINVTVEIPSDTGLGGWCYADFIVKDKIVKLTSICACTKSLTHFDGNIGIAIETEVVHGTQLEKTCAEINAEIKKQNTEEK
jgi:hypothetical protein